MSRKLSVIERSQQHLLDLILESLEKEIIPWHKPWNPNVARVSPYNPVTNKTYQNTNMFTLMIKGVVNEYTDPRWMTFNQAKSMGYTIKKGEKGTHLFYASWVDPKNGKNISEDYLEQLSSSERSEVNKRKQIRSKGFVVFNAQQITGIPELEQVSTDFYDMNSELAKEMVLNYKRNALLSIRTGESKAFYNQAADFIEMPIVDMFDTESFYYSTLFHEIAHSTMHEQRLNRDLSITGDPIQDYAIEELRAEISSAILGIDLGLSFDERHINSHKAYCGAWHSVLKDRPGLLTSIIKDAHEIRSYVIEKTEYDLLISSGIYDNIEIPLLHEEGKKVKVMTAEEIKEAVSIEELAVNHFKFNLNRQGRYMSLKEHDSVMIYPDNSFFRFSNRAGGSVIDFMMEFGNLNFKDALTTLSDYVGNNGYTELKFTESRERPTFELVEQESHSRNVYAYLTKSRHINPEIVSEYLRRGIVYQEKGKSNCIFVGRLGTEIHYATRRSYIPTSDFKADIAGSFAEVGIFFDNKQDTLVVTESLIDQMSYQSLEKNPSKYDYLSLNGVSVAKSAIRFHLIKRDNGNTKNIVIALDNDIKGHEATNAIIEMLNEEFPHINHAVIIPNEKDWNLELEVYKYGCIKDIPLPDHEMQI